MLLDLLFHSLSLVDPGMIVSEYAFATREIENVDGKTWPFNIFWSFAD